MLVEALRYLAFSDWWPSDSGSEAGGVAPTWLPGLPDSAGCSLEADEHVHCGLLPAQSQYVDRPAQSGASAIGSFGPVEVGYL
jgi:hypothetical protein